jgi:hypothetical protein
MNSKPKKQSTNAAGDRANVGLRDLKPKKDVKGGLRGIQFAGEACESHQQTLAATTESRGAGSSLLRDG